MDVRDRAGENENEYENDFGAIQDLTLSAAGGTCGMGVAQAERYSFDAPLAHAFNHIQDSLDAT